MKRAIDIAISLLALILLLPMLVCLSIAIRIDTKGNALIKSPCEGLNGKPFQMYRFRTTPAGDSANNLTPLGRFMQTRSIDKLPQLLNVLIGDMSIVGPKPHYPDSLVGGENVRDIVPFYDERHVAKPGITGWAQIHGLHGRDNNAEHAVSMVEHDVAYIQNYSLALDFKIIGRALLQELRSGPK